VIYFYGNGETAQSMDSLLTCWTSLYQVNIICVDYRGDGLSDGQVTLKTMKEDALLIFDGTVDLRAGKPTFVMSHSIGTIPACHLAARRHLDGLVLRAPISCFADVLPAWKRLFPWWTRPLTFLIRLKLGFDVPAGSEPLDDIAMVKSPLLVIHGDRDRVMPVKCGRKLCAAAASPQKTLVVIPRIGHNDLQLISGPDRDALAGFLDYIFLQARLR